MTDNTHSRRQFLRKYLVGGTMLLGGALVIGCNSMKAVAKEEPPKPLPHEDPKPAPTPQEAPKPVPQEAPKPKEAAAPNPCDDYTGVPASDLEKRKKLAYVTESPIPDSHCSNCALYLPPPAGKACGGCLLFKGPVRPNGYCAYWAPVNN